MVWAIAFPIHPMQRKSLAFRLIATSAGWSIVILAIAGYLFSSLFRSGSLVEATDLGDSRYVFPFQGWYWQVSSVGEGTSNEIRSASLLEQRLVFPPEAFGPRDDNGLSRFYYEGPEGHRLRVIAQEYQLDGSMETLSFVVTGNSDELEAEIATFNQTLLITLSILALGLVMAVLIQVRFGIQPLHRLRDGLVNIRKGGADTLGGEFPLELRPVVQELNALLTANKEIVDRARTQVGNLAHALKTPLSVVKNEAEAAQTASSEKIVEQADIMTDQISVYLDRARRAARAHVPGASADVRPILEGVIRTLKRIYAHRDVALTVEYSGSVRFLGEKQDLEEMVGNLLDNAFKWAKGQVVLRTRYEPQGRTPDTGSVILIVEDDGPGLPKDQREDALERGKRLDEAKPGSGLGLSIVAETVAMYDGEIELDEATSGGLRVKLILPGVGSRSKGEE